MPHLVVPSGVVGPVESKLVSMGKIKGLVVGAFGEASEGLHDLVDQLAESRVAVQVPNREKSLPSGNRDRPLSLS